MERTRKIPLLKVDSIKLDATIKSVQEHVSNHPPNSMSDIARILQQHRFAIRRLPVKTLNHQNGSKALNVRAFGKLSNEEKRDAKKYMRELSLAKEQLYIRKSWRSLTDAENIECKIKALSYIEAISIGNSEVLKKLIMINDDIDTNRTFEAYLMEYVHDTNDQKLLPTYAEFIDIIKYLPNWKAAGCDGIYNFFIKKCESIHPFLYKVIKEICLKGENTESWFYKGLTYLIPRGVPTRGSDFYLSHLIVERGELLAENQMAINKEHGNKLKTMWIDVKKS
ncbi:reverse transcriptase [Vairimorpha apis BRL 01]|uniref:Reverse transcriptase n=1 Tax=Vairimorpha apis BRL 01 TaxID=1037528 RepID=T0MBH6_9MICR|nr:reverse transcriptase [Vairimorpha apis BRL 01]